MVSMYGATSRGLGRSRGVSGNSYLPSSGIVLEFGLRWEGVIPVASWGKVDTRVPGGLQNGKSSQQVFVFSQGIVFAGVLG
jgi:hypothetical protein